MSNKVTISNTNNKVTITPQSNNSINASTTNTPVTITQGTAKVITVNAPGPRGPKGDLAGFSIDADAEIRNFTASGNISSSGFVSASSVHIAASAPNSLVINSGINDNAAHIYSTDDRVNVRLSDSTTNTSHIVGVGAEGNNLILRSDIGGVKFRVGGTDRISVFEIGREGSITTAQDSISDPAIVFGDGSNDIINYNNQELLFRHDGSHIFKVQSSGITTNFPIKFGSSANAPQATHLQYDETNQGIAFSTRLDGNAGSNVVVFGPPGDITASGAITASGGIKVGLGTFNGSDSNEAAKTDAALVIPQNSRIYTLDNDGGNLRNLISKGSDRVIDIGQNTIFIDEIRLSPGNEGFTSFYSGSTGTEIARIDAGGNITASGNISASGNVIMDGARIFGTAIINGDITASGDLTFDGNQTIKTIGVSDNISINPRGPLNLGSTDADSINIGRQFFTQEGAGKVRIYANTSTEAAVFQHSTITFNHPVTASNNISASGDVRAARFIASGSNNQSGFVFPNPTSPTDFSTNRITLTSAQNMQFRAGNVFQFTKTVEILASESLMLKNASNVGKILLDNAGTGIESRFRIRTGSVELVTVSGSGNVGIGTTTPEDKLTVKDGNALITGSSTHELEISTANFDGKARLRLNTLRSGSNAVTGLPRGMGSSNLYKSGALTFFDTDEDLKFRPNSRLALNIGGTGDIRFVSSTIAGSDSQIETTYFIGDASTRSVGIGIGNTTPGEALEVVGNISASGFISAGNITSSEALLGDLRIVGDKIQPSATNLTHLEIDASDARIQFNIAGSQFFKIDRGNPNSEFILGTTLLSSSFDFFTKGFSTSIPALHITSSGNVGIGTKTPDEKLTVEGNISVSGDLFVSRSIFIDDGTGTYADATIEVNSDILEIKDKGNIRIAMDSDGNTPNRSIQFGTGSANGTPFQPLMTISGSGQIKLEYDNMPTSDPNEKGIIYRSSSNGIDNLLFISAG